MKVQEGSTDAPRADEEVERWPYLIPDQFKVDLFARITMERVEISDQISILIYHQRESFPQTLTLILPFGKLKRTNVFTSEFSGLPCLLQLYTRLHLLDYSKFWNTEG